MHPLILPVARSSLVPTLQARYLAMLPLIERYTPLACRGLRCPDRRQEVAQEMRAVVWAWLARLAARGKDGSAFPASLAFLAARAVRSGRKLIGQEPAQDVLFVFMPCLLCFVNPLRAHYNGTGISQQNSVLRA